LSYPAPIKKTKIIATLGPSSSSYETIKEMVRAGADGFRINFSYGSPHEWSRLARLVLEVEEELEIILSLVGDLQGPNPRIGFLSEPMCLKRGELVELALADSQESVGEKKVVPVPLKSFFEVTERGDVIIMADGQTILEVLEREDHTITARVVEPGCIRSRNSVGIRGKVIPMPRVTEKDLSDIEFAVQHEFSHLMVSYVESAEHVSEIREILSKRGKQDISVIAKIESRKGVERVDSIITEARGVVVARGDLGKHFSLEEIPSIQKSIASKLRAKGKIAVLATQLLTSMLNSPTPTRSEVADIYNAVLEGFDALMLTNETAIGRYPIDAVKWLSRVIVEAERHYTRREELLPEPKGIPERFVLGLVKLALSLNAKLLVFSFTGRTAELVAQYRPTRVYFVGTPSASVARRVKMLWGSVPLIVEAQDYRSGIDLTRKKLLETGMVTSGEVLIEAYSVTGDREYLIRIYRCA